MLSPRKRRGRSAYSRVMLCFLAAALFVKAPISLRVPTGTREDKNGWIYIHVHGSPHDVGYENATLLAPELNGGLEALKLDAQQNYGKDWSWMRDTAYTLYWNKLDPEYQQEMQGMADGATDKGLKIDVKDILAMNAHIELEMYYLPWLNAHGNLSLIVSRAPHACSAFVATGSETANGKVVMGHNFWWSYFTGGRWKVLEDIKPANGHELVMDTLPGLIHSGTDWAQNDDGILLCETTISDFVGYDPTGIPEFQRMRKAIQYSSNLDDMVRIFKDGNNGGYANTWLMADTKNNEIGKLQLGLKHVIFDHTTDGDYYGANYPEDPGLMKDETPDYNPATQGNVCELRRERWMDLLAKNKGKVDAEMAKQFLSDTYDTETQQNDGDGSALCGKGFPGGGACNAKVTTTDMAAHLGLWGRMGIPDGTAEPRDEVISKYHFSGEMADLWPDFPSEPWTLFGNQ